MKKHMIFAAFFAASSMALAASPTISATAAPATTAPKQATTLPAGPDHLTMAKAQIEKFDTNKDGKVTMKEFLAPAVESFKKIDINGDGFVTAEELVEGQKRQMAEFEKARAATNKAALAAPLSAPAAKAGAAASAK
jgi:hypothetical protein